MFTRATSSTCSVVHVSGKMFPSKTVNTSQRIIKRGLTTGNASTESISEVFASRNNIYNPSASNSSLSFISSSSINNNPIASKRLSIKSSSISPFNLLHSELSSSHFSQQHQIRMFSQQSRGISLGTTPSSSSNSSSDAGGGAFSSKKEIMTITEDARDRVTELMSMDETSKGIRVSLRQRGCSGMSYVMDFQKDEPGKFDEVIHFKDAQGVQGTLFVDAKAVLFLVGTEMDYKEVEMGSEFVFNNPNQKSSCGCGQSFNV